MAVSCFREGKSYSISDMEFSECPVSLKIITVSKIVILLLSLSVFYHPVFLEDILNWKTQNT